MPDEYVTVHISGDERVRYCQKRRMTKNDFEKLSKMLNSGDRREYTKAEELIRDLFIDPKAVLVVDNFELEEFILDEDEA